MTQYDRVDFDKFQRQFKWNQGEHLVTVAPTGGGKSTLLSRVLPRRKFVCVLVTKIYDTTFRDEYLKAGYTKVQRFSDIKNHMDRVLLWPSVGRVKGVPDMRATMAKQKAVFTDAINRMFTQRGWTVVFDEQHYCANYLGLNVENAMLLHQGRSSGITCVNGTQRPAFVPVVTYSSASHAFIWRTTDRKDADRLSNLAGIEKREFLSNALTLGKHEFIYVPAIRGGDPVRSQVRL